MLILSRGTDDAIMIGDDIDLTVLSVKGKTVRLGIVAPNDISVHRSEIFMKVKRRELECRVDKDS